MRDEILDGVGLPLTEWREKFSDAFVQVVLEDGRKLEVINPVSNIDLGGSENDKKKVGGLTIDNDVVVAILDGKVIAFALNDSTRSGDFKVGEFDWNKIVDRVNKLEVSLDGKFSLGSGMAKNGGEIVYLPGTPGMILKPNPNGEVEGLVDLIAAANSKSSEGKGVTSAV